MYTDKSILAYSSTTIFRCPYYISRDLHKSVDILFAPYNYLIDRENRKSLSIEWSNSILIFDEAHNLVCCIPSTFGVYNLGISVYLSLYLSIFHFTSVFDKDLTVSFVYILNLVSCLLAMHLY